MQGASPEELLDGLTAAQRAAVVSESAPLCILASAGAGKTRVLTRRIAYRARVGTSDARHTLALTFTRKAAGELQHRLKGLGLREQVTAGTFHSMASAQLQRWWADRRQTAPVLLDRKGRLLAQLASSRPGLGGVAVLDLATHIEWAKARMIEPDAFSAAVVADKRDLPPGVTAGALASLYARYESEKTKRGLVDFDDLLVHCANALERDAEFAGAQRWRWRHVFVDEFQDLNPLQHRLLLAWLGPSRDLCVVGDPNQAIYGWNGADPGLLARFGERWPGTEVIRLDANHRCSPQIVAAASAVLGSAGGGLHSATAAGPLPAVRAYPSEVAEAQGLAAGLRQANRSGRPWRTMAVLTRTNAQLVPIQRALTSAGIPFWAPAQAALLEDPAARQVLSELRRNPQAPMQAVAADLAEAAAGDVADDASRAVLAALAELAKGFVVDEPRSTAGHWLAWLPAALRDSSDAPGRSDVVTLCTFHRAKGLEWDAVWVAGVEQGLVPIGRASTRAAHDEEQRLLYVALTRASIELHCSWAQQRTFGTRTVPREPSMWLERIESAARPGSARNVDGAAWRARFDEQRRSLKETSKARKRPLGNRLPAGWPEPDPDLVGAIKAWRRDTSRATGVPAYVVLHDATVEALASLRPANAQELLAVPGLGPVKAGRYGPTLLSLVAARAASA